MAIKQRQILCAIVLASYLCARMPSDQSTWLIAVPNDGEAEGLGQELHSKVTHQSKSSGLAQLDIPSFKVSEYLRNQ